MSAPPIEPRVEPRIEHLGARALLLRFGDRIDPGLGAQVHAATAAILARRPRWLVDLVPAFASLAVHLDPAWCARPGALAHARDWLRICMAQPLDGGAFTGQRTIEIPVHYGGEHGPDLAELAAHAGMDEARAIALHARATYTVGMLGFSPGFPYLHGLPPALSMPRLASPRTRVPAGSVAIGGAQAGIYPVDSPGGWRLIGWTPACLFDPVRDPPALLAPGDRVRFVPSP